MKTKEQNKVMVIALKTIITGIEKGYMEPSLEFMEILLELIDESKKLWK